MSVHAAKGLEFAIVALGDISAQKHARNDLLLDPTLGLLLPIKGEDDGTLPAIYLKAREQEEEQERQESARLLYVAATRAREMLLISGCMQLNKDKRPGGLGEWLAWLAGPLGLTKQEITHQETGESVIRLALQAGSVPVACAVYEPGCSWECTATTEPSTMAPSVPSDLPLLAPYRAPVAVASETRQAPELGPRVWRVMPGRGRASAPHWVVGQLVHEALSAWRFPDVGFEDWATARARTLGLIDPHALRDAATRSARLLQRFRDHALYEEMQGAERRLTEAPYSVRTEDGRIDNGVIDALYQRAGQWTIVEFKTDHVTDAARMKQLLETQDYLQQAERYVRAVEQLLGERPRHLFCWLDYAGKVVCESRGVRHG